MHAKTRIRALNDQPQADAVHSTPMPNSPSLNAAFITAGVQLLNVRAHHIVGEPDRHDAEELVACLRRLAAIIDPAVAAIGSYANHHFGWVDLRLFKDQLLNALSCARWPQKGREWNIPLPLGDVTLVWDVRPLPQAIRIGV